ncbi:Ctr copper transporter family protein [Nitzschia inconspicua]|uniref:Copper transport protein n=1 Tax=Nitzschia inconspicua TaxID=303405 RepID=A0A9K3L3S0_9STRA|nr:Ctr copper transporter family protein [Nitzschia inconspicua]
MDIEYNTILEGSLHDIMDHMHYIHDQQHDHDNIEGVMGEVRNEGNEFCQGMGMIMYMDGFQWTLKRQSSCLNFYFPTWTLDSQTKFVMAMLCVILMGIFTEAIGRIRHDVNKKARRTSSTRQLNRLWYLQTVLQGANALMAYVLMLATMTYSLEILGCVVLGLMIGYFIFGGDLYNHAGSVCCQFLEDEEEDSTMATMTNAILRTITSNDDQDGDHEADESRSAGYHSPSVANEIRGEERCCSSNNENNDENSESNHLHTRLLSEVA